MYCQGITLGFVAVQMRTTLTIKRVLGFTFEGISVNIPAPFEPEKRSIKDARRSSVFVDPLLEATLLRIL